MKVAIVNESTLVTNADAQRCVQALQIQVDRDFSGIWGIDAALQFLPSGSALDPDMWELVILDNSDQANALGYHELSQNGFPLGKIFVGSDIEAGTQWTVTASHELLEMLADPWINTVAEINNGDGTIDFYAYEVCDACEADNFGYSIDIKDGGSPVLVSDFVTPEWFQPGWPNKTFDEQAHISQALEILSGGYISIFKSTGGGWTQVMANKVPGGPKAPRGSRRERRMRLVPRFNWMRSAR
jgi:hypothetical protein